jgi:hypothetical protein
VKVTILKVTPLPTGDREVLIGVNGDQLLQMKLPANVTDLEGFARSVLRARSAHLIPKSYREWVDNFVEFDTARTDAPSPPLLAALFISFLAPENTAQAQLGDLQEMFQKNVERLGAKQARRIYLMQVAASAWPLIWRWLTRIGFFAAFIGYVRSKFGL